MVIKIKIKKKAHNQNVECRRGCHLEKQKKSQRNKYNLVNVKEVFQSPGEDESRQIFRF